LQAHRATEVCVFQKRSQCSRGKPCG